MSRVAKVVRVVADFWVDFLIGDTPEIFVGVLVVVGGALLLRHERAAGLIFLVAVTALVFVLSTVRGREHAD